jgi:hypothetical protein
VTCKFGASKWPTLALTAPSFYTFPLTKNPEETEIFWDFHKNIYEHEEAMMSGQQTYAQVMLSRAKHNNIIERNPRIIL